MVIKVEDIPPEGLEVEFKQEKRWWKQEEKRQFLNVDLARPVVAKISLSVMREKIHVTGKIETVLQLFCARCLEPFFFPLKAEMDFMLFPRSLEPQHEAVRLKKEDMEIEFFDGVEINIDQIVAEQIFLHVPMKPICKPDCKGLCPVCGKNLNKETCNCERPRFSPFYEALKHLKKKAS